MTMSREQLNNLMILHVHHDYTDSINLKDVANDFVSKSDSRSLVFELLIISSELVKYHSIKLNHTTPTSWPDHLKCARATSANS